jgi:hypothetical protein
MHAQANVYDTVDGHRALVERLQDEFPDGWALSASSPSLRTILPLCPEHARVMAWVKPFAAFKPNVGVAYAWEPVVFCGGRKRSRKQPTVRDWHSENITMRRGFPGAKPAGFCIWICNVLNVQEDDTIVDLFPGSWAFTEATRLYFQMLRYEVQSELFGVDG